MLTISKMYKFDAAHFIPDHPACGQLHGHTYTLEVELTLFDEDNILKSVLLSKEEDRGMLIDYHKLDSIVKGTISKLDHKELNSNIHLSNIRTQDGTTYPTCELLAWWFTNEIGRRLIEEKVQFDHIKVTIQEGQGGKASWRK